MRKGALIDHWEGAPYQQPTAPRSQALCRCPEGSVLIHNVETPQLMICGNYFLQTGFLFLTLTTSTSTWTVEFGGTDPFLFPVDLWKKAQY